MAILANLKMKKLLIIPHFLEEYRARKLRVGFSGGADSTALLLLLLHWGFKPNLLEAVHFDHGLRGSASTADGEWCREFCAGLGVNFVLVKLDLADAVKSGCSLEDAARDARLAWYRAHDDNSPIVLAHHAGDVQENILLKLARGGNVSSLTSLRSVRNLWNLTILRPLLEWHKKDLEEFLRQEQVNDWRNDATNQQNDYHRNFLRNELLPRWNSYHAPVQSALDRAAKVLAMDADFIEKCAGEKLAELGKVLPEKTQVCYWLDMHKALLGRVLRSYLAQVSGAGTVNLTFQQLENFRNALLAAPTAESRIIELNQSFWFRRRGDMLEFLAADCEKCDFAPVEWHWQQQKEIEYANWYLACEVLAGAVCTPGQGVFYFDCDAVPATLYCALRRGGEVMSVWGSQAPRHVKHLLSGKNFQENVLLVKDAQDNIIILGDLRRSTIAPVANNTRKTLKIVVKSPDKQ